MGKQNKITIVNAEKENYKKMQESKPKRKHKPRYANKEQLDLSRNTTRLVKAFPGLGDRKGVRAMLKTVKHPYTQERFIDGIFDIIKKHTKLNYINKKHNGFWNVMVGIHRHFRKWLDFDDDMRAKYADKLLGIYDEYKFDEDMFDEDNKTLEIAEQDLRYLYIERGYSSTQIGNVFGCSNGTVLNRLRKLKIPRRPTGGVSPIRHEVSLSDQLKLVTPI